MELIDVMLKRRSTRKFNDEPVTKEELDKILQAALLAPTSMNRKPCNFMVVERKETLTDLANSKDHGADLINGADKAIVVVADTMVADTWIEDSSIALTYMHLMATELGLGSCWVQIHLRSKNGKDSEELVRDILKIDDHYRIVGIMALGHSDDIPPAHEPADVDKNKVHFMV
ncbi:MAG: nitroreductase family protein [Methanobrevibacter sp.]|uniref:nitroreductase family protein n=1 Tax=Methanobrevibacter sp. UBA212 TaxID=1915476 RepID=UPI0025FDCE98|nr:nitroreductase family protein [Methanobrevibacter sp. UBA212]MBR3155885.1 nitroreductase family protein [Methanobrevibacter sp.]